MMPRFAIPTVAALASALPVSAQLTGYETITDWEAIAWSKSGLSSELFSSYDRSGANLDFNYYVSPTGYQTAAAGGMISLSAQGPGVVRRFWMPHGTADLKYDLRVTIDGVVVYDTDTDLYLEGAVGNINTDLTQTLVGGQTSYEPLVFQDSILVETSNPGDGSNWPTRHYYQFNVQTFAPGTTVDPSTGTFNVAQLAARNQAVQIVQAAGDNPAGVSGTSITALTPASSIAPATALTIANPAGDGTMRALNLMMTSATDAELDALRLRVRYDGDVTNAIDVPVSHFFGVGAGRDDYQSLPLGVADDGSFYSYWPMPYREGATVELYNTSGSSIAIDSAAVEIEPGDVAPQAGYLHAVYNEETTTAGQTHHQLLDVDGRGHYVGNMLWLELPDDRRSILEGDDIIAVDGGTIVHYGTGLEDAYNGGYYYNHVVVQPDDGDVPNPESGDGPFGGLLRMDFDTLGDPNTRTDQYRWLIPDPVEFDQDIDVKIENFGNQAGVQFGSTAFYYLVNALEGDLDGDGGVGINDLDIVLANWGPADRLGDWRTGDLTSDGWVGEDDLQVVLDNWSIGPPPAIIPEPGTAGVLIVGIMGLLRRRQLTT